MITIVKKNAFLKFFILYVFLLPILLYFVGIKDPIRWRDHDVYNWYFEQAKNNDISYILSNVQDPFFTILNKISTLFGLDFYGFCFLLAFITIFLKFTGFALSKSNFFVIVLLYCSLTLGLQDHTQIRVAFAISLITFGIYFFEKKWIQFLFLIAALFFHFSTIIVFISYVFYWLSRKKFINLIIYIFSLSVIFIGSTSIFREWGRFNQYLENHTYYNVFASIPMLQSISIIYVIYKYKQEALQLELVIALSGLSAYYFLYITPAAATRYMEVTSVFYIIFIARFFSRDLFVKVICLGYFLLNIFNLFLKPASFFYYYYQSLLSIL